jgi:hypothetical protein
MKLPAIFTWKIKFFLELCYGTLENVKTINNYTITFQFLANCTNS